MEVSWVMGVPPSHPYSSIFIRIHPYHPYSSILDPDFPWNIGNQPSILGYPHLWKPPNGSSRFFVDDRFMWEKNELFGTTFWGCFFDLEAKEICKGMPQGTFSTFKMPLSLNISEHPNGNDRYGRNGNEIIPKSQQFRIFPSLMIWNGSFDNILGLCLWQCHATS